MTDYTLRPLCSKDVFPMFRIISAIGIKEFRACFESDEIKRVAANGEGNPDYTAVGIGVFLDIAGIIVGNLPKCETDIYNFLVNISNLSRKEVEDMPLADFAQMIIDVVQKPEFKDFIGVVSKLFKSEK